MFNLRNRFGLACSTLSAFERNKLSYMHSTKGWSEAVRNIDGNKEVVHDVDTALKNVDLTPGEYIYNHHVEWLDKPNDNFHTVAYENLINNFEPTMLKIAKFLGSDKTEFLNESDRVGWYDVNDVYPVSPMWTK